MIFVIKRDLSKPDHKSGQYCIGFKHEDIKYFHVKLGPKTIICGYESHYEKSAEYTYKAIMHIDAYGLRKAKLKPILILAPDLRRQMATYTL